MLIRKLVSHPPVYDVFGNTGFDSWTRLRRYGQGETSRFAVIGGTRVDHDVFRHICATIEANPNGSVDNL